jgi:cysteinyl-tRNA synthetase
MNGADEEFLALLDRRRQDFERAMDDDLNSALATGILFDAVGDINAYLHRAGKEEGPCGEAMAGATGLLEKFNSVLGFFKTGPGGKIILDGGDGQEELAGGLINLIIKIRQEARSKKDWAAADSIRDGLKELGIVLEDTPQGVRWKRQV